MKGRKSVQNASSEQVTAMGNGASVPLGPLRSLQNLPVIFSEGKKPGQ